MNKAEIMIGITSLIIIMVAGASLIESLGRLFV